MYTKTGDKGTSSLYNGERRSKTDAIFQALGDVDELNSAVGLARAYVQEVEASAACLISVSEHLEETQSRLLDVGSAIATPVDSSSARKLAVVQFDATAPERLEGWIDAMDEELPALTAFILPSGGKASAHLHVARTLCRRAERSVVSLSEGNHVDQTVCVYLNRLSDYLFTAARYCAQAAQVPETTYKKARG